MNEAATQQLVIFTVGEEEYALPIAHVHEIIRFTDPRAVASTDPSVRGVISLRGKILPVYDLMRRLGMKTDAVANGKIVIVEADGTVAGVVVDDVAEVLTVSPEQFDADGGREVVGQGVDAIVKVDERLVVLLDPARIVHLGSGADADADPVVAPVNATAAEPVAAAVAAAA